MDSKRPTTLPNEDSKKDSKKKKFMEAGNFTDEEILSISQIRPTLEHWKQKHNISFVINGETKSGSVTAQKSKHAVESLMNDLKDDTKKYVAYLQNFFQADCVEHMEKDARGLPLLIPPTWHGENKAFLESLSKLSAEQIKIEIDRKPHIKQILDERIQHHLGKTLPKKHLLTKTDCVAEIKEIQKSLGEGEAVVYVFNGGGYPTDAIRSHTETIIITPQALIKPVHYGNLLDEGIQLTLTDLPEMHIPIQHALVKCYDSKNVPPNLPLVPQVTNWDCVTFSLQTCKEYLKEKTNQLNDLMLFTHVDRSNNNTTNYFVPSPNALRYSQLEKYNEVLFKMVTEQSEDTFINLPGEAKSKPPTLRGLLQDSFRFGYGKNPESDAGKIGITAKAGLRKLTPFSDAWKEAYEKAKAQRKVMTDPQGKSRYIMQRALAIKERAKLAELKNSESKKISELEKDDVFVEFMSDLPATKQNELEHVFKQAEISIEEARAALGKVTKKDDLHDVIKLRQKAENDLKSLKDQTAAAIAESAQSEEQSQPKQRERRKALGGDQQGNTTHIATELKFQPSPLPQATENKSITPIAPPTQQRTHQAIPRAPEPPKEGPTGKFQPGGSRH